ncbi:hypothetical protein HY413_01940 [Candidatus Kaiserbacteria bacterium]|nr:hypothetical protein [Candidatus Kaiserbacteria bacterium]
MKKYTQILNDIGLSPNEAKIYEALLQLKNGTIWDISKHAEVHRRNAYDAIQRLIARGLAYQVLPKKVLTYAPVHPDKLRELVDENVRSLESALPGLRKRFDEIDREQSIAVYRGVQGVKNYLHLLIRDANPRYVFGAKGLFPALGISTLVRKAESGTRKHNRIIYQMSERARLAKEGKINARYRFLPEKYSTDTSVSIFGDYVALVGAGIGRVETKDDAIVFVVKDARVAADYKKWFEFMWDHLPAEK